MSTPWKESAVNSCTGICRPRKGSFLPAERAEASKVNWPDGKFPFLQRLDHFDADGARGADDGNVRFGVHA